MSQSTDTHTARDWNIEVKKDVMFSSGDLAELEARLGSVKLPDIVFGNSSLKISNASADIAYSFLAEDALRYCSFAYRSQKFTTTDLSLDSINELPKEVKVADASLWEERKMPKDVLFKEPGV
jgi:hypothetical protein